jgi:2-keto-4-pentenoate hydratase
MGAMTSASSFDAARAAGHLVAARRSDAPAPHVLATPPDRAAAFAVQEATLASLGPRGGWKVGAKDPNAEPGCAPLPASGLLPTGAQLVGAPWKLRGIEVEVALRLGRDLVPADGPPDAHEIQSAIDAVLPVMEVVETRLADWRASDPLAQLADLQSHGALVIGEASQMPPAQVDLRTLQAYLAFDGQPVASTRGANPAADIWRLLGWLAWHCVQRGEPLRAGQVVTTGSCTGLLFAPEGARVDAHLEGIGRVQLQF